MTLAESKPYLKEREPFNGVIADMHFNRGTNGVATQMDEMDSWLANNGITVIRCAGNVNSPLEYCIPELSYQSPEAEILRSKMFPREKEEIERIRNLSLEQRKAKSSVYLEEIDWRAAIIKEKVGNMINNYGIGAVHVRNIMSLPLNLAATYAMYQLAQERDDIRFIFHHHDLPWEGPVSESYGTPYESINERMEEIICPDLPNVSHIVINPVAQESLKEKKGIEAHLIPDGLNFEYDFLQVMEEKKFRRKFGIDENDLVLGMMTRVVLNKNIEGAIQFARTLEDEIYRQLKSESESADAFIQLARARRRFGPKNKVILLLTQNADRISEYHERLIRYAKELGVKLIDISGDVVADPEYKAGDNKIPFQSVHRYLDLDCYPTEHEGFGNQLPEAVRAMVPIAMLRYPVAARYIAPEKPDKDHPSFLPHYISLGNMENLHHGEGAYGLNCLDDNVVLEAARKTIEELSDSDKLELDLLENFAAMRGLCDIRNTGPKYLEIYKS